MIGEEAQQDDLVISNYSDKILKSTSSLWTPRKDRRKKMKWDDEELYEEMTKDIQKEIMMMMEKQ
jgi:hypothetical protein